MFCYKPQELRSENTSFPFQTLPVAKPQLVKIFFMDFIKIKKKKKVDYDLTA